MRAILVLCTIALTYSVASAQAPQVPTAAQRCGQVVGALEGENASLGERYDLQALDLQRSKARIKELEDKYEPPKKDDAH